MNDHLQQLVRLQDLMQAIESVEAKIAAVPQEVGRLEKELLAAQEGADRERAGLEELQKGRRRLEMDLMGVESKIEKYQSQLSAVKTNKEYQAILKEIETARVERAALDEKILVEMEETDRRQAEFRAHEQALKDRRRTTDESKARLADLVEALKREKGTVDAERERLASGVPRGYLEPFLKVARQRQGLALVPVRDELCGGCHVRVMPTLIQQVRRATGLIACDSCKRYLYVPDSGPPGPGERGSSPEASAGGTGDGPPVG